jgi:hypothetical protein
MQEFKKSFENTVTLFDIDCYVYEVISSIHPEKEIEVSMKKNNNLSSWEVSVKVFERLH